MNGSELKHIEQYQRESGLIAPDDELRHACSCGWVGYLHEANEKPFFSTAVPSKLLGFNYWCPFCASLLASIVK